LSTTRRWRPVTRGGWPPQFGRRIFDDVIVSTDRRILGERTAREG